MPRREFWLVAGPNGAGKTTLVQARPISLLLPHVRFLNPDDIALTLLRNAGWDGFHDAPAPVLNAAFLRAAEQSFSELNKKLLDGHAMGIETVLSTEKYLPVVKWTLRDPPEPPGFFGLIYIWLNTPDLACDRVLRRAKLGGHDVEPQKIVSRWHRSITNLPVFARQASAFWVFDNSDPVPANAPVLLARGAAGKLLELHENAPAAVRQALDFGNVKP